MYQTQVDSPLGPLTLASDGKNLTGLWMKGQKYYPTDLDAEMQPELPVFCQTAFWLDAYFQRTTPPPMPPLAPAGSSFRQAVWRLLREIPYGTITTYGDLFRRLQASGISASAQSVGGAVGHNPISILIPCHRVIGSNGSLTGYAGGVKKKSFLLELEGVDTASLRVPIRGSAL